MSTADACGFLQGPPHLLGLEMVAETLQYRPRCLTRCISQPSMHSTLELGNLLHIDPLLFRYGVGLYNSTVP